jgi:hypothetical protein
MNQAEMEALLLCQVDDPRGLGEAVAIRAYHWAHSGVVRPGQRREIEVGRGVELVSRLCSTRSWSLARRPPASACDLHGARLAADVPGVYVVHLEISGFVRSVELVAVSSALLGRIGPRDGMNDRALTLRCRINEPGRTTAELVSALEADPPTWGALAAPAS